MKDYLKLTILFFIPCLITYAQGGYNAKHLNGPFGGIIGDIAIDSFDNLYAGVYSFFNNYSGIYKSVDNGESWIELKTDFENIEIYSIFINYDNEIYLGTSGFGLHYSSNFGDDWARIDSGYTSREWYAIGQNQNGDMFAGDAQYKMMFKSLNKGFTWQFIDYLSPINFSIDKNNVLYAGTLDSYYYSIDDGNTWLLNKNFIGTPVSDILPINESEILLGTGYSSISGKGLFKSYDSGKNWELKGLQNKVNILSLAKDRQNNIYCAAGDDGIYQSNDFGENWTIVNGWNGNQAFRIRINSRNELFIGSEDEGIFRSIDQGNSFKQIGLPISKVTTIDKSNDGKLLYTSTPSGVQLYDVNNLKWKNAGLHGIQSLTINPKGTIFAASGEAIFRSYDNCASWEKLPLEIGAYNIKAVNDTTLLLATPENLLISRDEGSNWRSTEISTGFFRNAIDYESNSGTIIILGHNGINKTIFLSNDFGKSFSEIEIELSPYNHNSIAIDNNQYIYIASNLISNDEQGIYKSKYPYNVWEKIYDGLSYCLHVSNNGTLYAGCDIGVLQSFTKGTTWQLIFTDKMDKTFPLVIFSNDYEKLYVGTESYGMFELILPTDVRKDNQLTAKLKLFQNFPNPFNSTTSINYSISESGFISLEVYNILGEFVETLTNKFQFTGKYEINYDGNDLSSGIYYYRIKSNNLVETKKMILMK